LPPRFPHHYSDGWKEINIERVITSPRTGRPPTGISSKDKGYRIRMSNEESERLDFCCNALNLTKAEVIRQGIETMYQKAIERKKESLD
jgi:hypothetical protein